MRHISILAVAVLFALSVFPACGGGSDNNDQPKTQCNDGVDNDGDGDVDFPDDLGCTSLTDDSENSLPSPACMDGRDNDGDGKIDFPDDPGCFLPQADDETDDCPDGPNCPECADGKDNDDNGLKDYPQDPGCTSAGDGEEFLHNAIACGAGLMVQPLPPGGEGEGTLGATSLSNITSPCGGGGGSPAFAYELHLTQNKVVEISTDDQATEVDTVIDVRSEMCSDPASEVACHDDISPTNMASHLTVPLDAGVYYIIVSGHDSSSSGAYHLQIKTYSGEHAACATEGDCGPGLFCRVPHGGTGMSCEKPACNDGIDDDDKGDGADYPMDPGCSSPTDNDETDDCPSGPNCPECSNGIDDDHDNKTDYPNDPTCAAAGDASETCPSTDGVQAIITGMTMSTTVGAVNDVMLPSGSPTFCESSASLAPDKTFRLDLPATTTLTISPDSEFDASIGLFDSTCMGVPLACEDFGDIVLANQQAGSYYVVVDGYFTDETGAFTLTVSGEIAQGGSCEGALAQAGALTCKPGTGCKGTMGSRTCQPVQCSDGINNGDGDNKIDYPNDPGCDSPLDDDETDPATPPVCSNGIDDDTDGATDYPADTGCSSAAGTSEKFCALETDPVGTITTNPIEGTTVGKTNNFSTATTCPTTKDTYGLDVAYQLSLPVAVTTLTVDLSDGVDPNLTSFDTVVSIKDASCSTQVACDDDGGDPSLESKVVKTNVSAGSYAIIIDGYQLSGSTGNAVAGTYNMVVKGTVAAGLSCSSPLFNGGANAVLSCLNASGAAGTCNTTTHLCQ
ncbi:MAG TPA: hypothetical protein VGM90_37655 [Kofleriaceae bacterium]|jgi:hypothetical protein